MGHAMSAMCARLVRPRGFTLIELLVVVAIIGILAAMSLAKVQRALLKAKEGQTRANLDGLRKGVEMYAATNAFYPQRLGGSDADIGWPTWGVGPIESMRPYLNDIPPCLISPNSAMSNGVWNVVTYDPDDAGNDDGWRYAYWPVGFVGINNGTVSTEGDKYSYWGYTP